MIPVLPSLTPTDIPARRRRRLAAAALAPRSTTYHLRHNHVQALTRTVHSPILPPAGLVRPRVIAV